MMTVRTDRELVSAAGRSTRYTLTSIVAPRAERTDARPPANVSIVLDRSGSMGGQKFELARRAVDHALRLLRSEDRFSLVVYDEHIDVLVESTLATPEARRHAGQRLESVHPRGSTDLCGGWLAGCEQVARYITDGGAGRCLLLTDGLANHGTTDRETIVNHARELRRRGVVTSTFGVGADFDERLLQQMADAGAGHFYFIERPVQIPDFLTSELGETLEVVASGVTLTVDVDAGIHPEVLNAFRTVHRRGQLSVDLGDLVSGQELSVVTQFEFSPREDGTITNARFKLTSADGRLPPRSVEQTWRFATEGACQGQSRNQLVDEAVGAIFAARAEAEAVELNRRGDFEEAERVLAQAAGQIRTYAGDSDALRRAIRDLQKAAAASSRPMSALELKEMHFSAASALRARSPEGKARRSE